MEEQECKFLHIDNLIGVLDCLLQIVRPPVDSLCKFNHPYIDCIKFDFDSTQLDRRREVQLARKCLDVQFVVESLQHILEFIDFKVYPKKIR